MLISQIYSSGHLALGLAELLLIGWALNLFRQSKSLAMLVLPILLLSLGYDNLVLATGNWISVGDLLHFLSEIRFLLHCLIIPFFIVVGVELANQAGAGWAISLVRGLAWVVAIGLGLLGYLNQFPHLALEPVQFAGVLRYTVAGPTSLPIITIVVNLFMLAIGVGIWVRLDGKWPWLFLGTLVGLMGNALPLAQVGTLPGSGSEFVLALSLLFTEQYQQRHMAALGLDDDSDFRIIPLNFNWVAIHPQPKGVIYFIGGAGFGSFPTLFYRYLLRRCFQQGYTIVAIPFRFTLNHWSVAIRMVRDQRQLLADIQREATFLGYTENLEVYQEPAIRSGRYHWMGHSLGCKYITLLQRLTDLEILSRENEGNTQDISEVIHQYVPEDKQADRIIAALSELGLENLDKLSLENQPAILMAPIITGIEGAIPIKAIADIVKKFIDARPSEEETKKMIDDSLSLEQSSRYTRFMAIIGFKDDQVQAKAKTVDWLIQLLKKYNKLTDDIVVRDDGSLGKGHLAPLNLTKRNNKLANYIIYDVLPDLETKVGLLAAVPPSLELAVSSEDEANVTSVQLQIN